MGGTYRKDTQNNEVYNLIWGINFCSVLCCERILLKEERK